MILILMVYFFFTVIYSGFYYKGQCSILRDCKDYLEEKWAGSWIEPYKVNGLLYAVFGPKGNLLCYRKATIEYANEIDCNANDAIITHVNDNLFLNFSKNANSCVAIHQRVIQSTRNHSQESFINGTLKLCFTQEQLANIPIITECYEGIRNYSIPTKNFLFYDYATGKVVYRTPTVRQYEFLKSIGHRSVSDDYDYDHF